MTDNSTLPLSGIRVLEIGSTVAAPAAARLLADFGADVVKVEPADGDHLRTWGEVAPDGTSWWFKSHNRNKAFVQLDMNNPADCKQVRRLALDSDVLIENFRPGRMANWGLGYEDLAAVHPGLVYVSISGYGQDGPKAGLPGFGHIAEGMSGFRYVTGYPDRPPVRVGLSVGDEVAALYAAFGAMVALRARDRDGRGEHVDVSLVEALFSLTEGILPEFIHAGKVTERAGNRYLRAAPSGIYTTRDGKYLSVAANSQPIFRRFCRAMGRPELADDPLYATNQARIANNAALDEIIEEWVNQKELAEVTDALDSSGVPAGPVYSIAELVADSHFRFRGAVASLPADARGPAISTPGLVPRLRNHPGRLSHSARHIGADQQRVLNTVKAKK